MGRFICTLGACIVMWSLPAAAHPSLYFDTPRLDELKQLSTVSSATSLGWSYADAFNEIVKVADQYLASKYKYTVEIPNPNGNGGVSWTYEISSSMPPAHPNNPGYPPWTAVSRGLQSRMEVLSFVHAVTGDSKYLKNAQGTGALDVANAVAAWSKWTDPEYKCGTGNSCLDTAHLSLGVGLTYDLGFGSMTESERNVLRNALISKGVTPLFVDVKAAKTSAGMAAWFNGFALRVTGLAVGACAVAPEASSQSDAWTTLAHEAVTDFFGSQGKDGGAFEGQLYGSYAVDNLVIAAHVLKLQSIGSNLFDHPWLSGLPRFAGAFLASDNRTQANFGDSSSAAYWSTTMFALAAHGNTTAQWYLVQTKNSQPRSFLNLLWARPELQPTPIPGSGTSLYQDVGHAVLRDGFDGAPVVAVKSGPPTEKVGHNHLDHNSFIISAHGQWVASDPGYQDYYNASKHLFTTGTIGHNTIIVDKTVAANGSAVSKGQVSNTGGKLDFLFDGKAYAKVVAQAASTYEAGLLDRFGRRIFYAKPDLVFVFDDLSAPKAHAYSFLLHSGASGSFQSGQGPSELMSSVGNATLQTFFASSTPLASGYPKVFSHPGAEDFGPYGEWRSQTEKQTRFAAAFVPGFKAHTTFDNPGFENGLNSWQPRFSDGTHASDDKVARSGKSSARIEFKANQTGYYYSEVMSLVPGSTLTAKVFTKSKAAKGSIYILPYFTLGGSFIDNPAGSIVKIDASTATDWTEIELIEKAPPSGVDGVRIALQFNGEGTIWFDDASYFVDTQPPQTEPAKAITLGNPPVGLVVSGPWGIDVGASFVGSGQSGVIDLQPANSSIPQVQDVSVDAEIFAFGLDLDGSLKRAFFQGGTLISLGGKPLVQATEYASFDLAIHRKAGCVQLYVEEVPSLEASGYRVNVIADEVWLGNERVPFTIHEDMTVFPEGEDLGKGCQPIDEVPDASTSDGGQIEEPSTDGGLLHDASVDSSSSDVSNGGDGGDGEGGDSEGCACRIKASHQPSRWLHPWTMVGILLLLRRARAFRRHQGK